MSDQTQGRGNFIPVRRSELCAALFADCRFREAGLEDKAQHLTRLLASLLHFEYFEDLEQVRDLYARFDPMHPAPAGQSAPDVNSARAEFMVAFRRILQSANFVEVDRTEIERAHQEHGELRVQVRSSMDGFHDARLFRRGRHQEEVTIREKFHLKTRRITIEMYDDVVLVAIKKTNEEVPEGRQRRRLGRDGIRPGAVLVKQFCDIASADLDTLFPDTRVVMSRFDKLWLGVPALMGGVPLIIKLAPMLLVLYGLTRFYFGLDAALAEDRLKEAVIVASGTIALGGFLGQQWLKYQKQTLKYQKEVSDKIYFHNLNNNAGTFDHLVGEAEEQECKEALLAYFFLLTAGEPLTQEELDAWVERWLKLRFSTDVDFEVDDALGKLERLHLVERHGANLTVPPLDEALRRLDYHWDNLFSFNVPAR